MSHADDHGYRLGEVLGQGAVATVVRVQDDAGREYAGKILHESHRQDETAVKRFEQEAELLAGLRHENLVALHGVRTIAGRRVLLMELVDGPTLETLIAREAPLPEPVIIALGRGIAAGLSEAHAAGLIHRDLKPANVLLARGAGDHASGETGSTSSGYTPKIADFGMARATSFAGVDPSALTILGTPDYMAPESLDPLAVDPRSDLYALGCILHECATGRPPYSAATPFGVLEQHRGAAIPTLPDAYSPELRALVQSLLAKSPADRPQAAQAVAQTLTHLRAGGPPGAALAAVTVDMARCAGCGQELILELGVCMHCGLVTARVDPGGTALLVTGPGNVGDKLDATLRERLVSWIGQNPGLKMEPGALGKTIPRLPFTLATRISRASAEAVGASLTRLGLEYELVEGGPLRSQPMRKKAMTMAGRALAIVVAMFGAFASNGWMLASVPLILLVTAFVAGWQAVRRKTRALPASAGALPPALAAAVRRVEQALPALDAERHRDGLRAAVGRAIALSRSPAADDETIVELAQAVDLATVAAGRLSALERTLLRRDMRESSDEERAMLHERDRWAAHLLDLTATLDAFQARVAAATTRAGAQDAGAGAREDEDPLEDLRARVEALEEIREEVERR